MTAFANFQLDDPKGLLIWEIRSLNHRFCEISLNIPNDLGIFEDKLRELVLERIKRGRIVASLQFYPNKSQGTDILLNESLATSLHTTLLSLATKFGMDKPNLDSIISYKGVLNCQLSSVEELGPTLLSSMNGALDILLRGRKNEGGKIKSFMDERLDSAKQLICELQLQEESWISVYREKLLNKVTTMGISLHEGRLEQEIALIAEKADIAEEIHRLTSHLDDLESILLEGGVVGRKIDFILQELHREVNTIGSKAVDIAISKIIVNLKVLFEQMLEQIQNIE